MLAAAPEHAFAALGIAAGGLAAGILVPGERIGAALLYFAVGITGIVASPNARAGLLFGVGLCVADIVFLLLPAKLLRARIPAQDGEARRPGSFRACPAESRHSEENCCSEEKTVIPSVARNLLSSTISLIGSRFLATLGMTATF